jgi:hypothetical protein
MSLELKIEALTQAVIALTAKFESGNVAPVAAVAPAQIPVVQAAPVVEAAPVTVTVTAPAMPAPPAFVAPAPVAPHVVSMSAPFNDGKGLIDYVMGAYKALGTSKGAQIQNVLTSMGYQNINDVKPEHYGQLFSGVEALK